MASVKRGAEEAEAKSEATSAEAESASTQFASSTAVAEQFAQLMQRIDQLEQRVTGRLDENTRGLRGLDARLAGVARAPSSPPATLRKVEVRLAESTRRSSMVVAGITVYARPRVVSVTERKLEQLRAEQRVVVTPAE
jgi:hypothetical protein